MIGVAAIPAILFLAALFSIPRSPALVRQSEPDGRSSRRPQADGRARPASRTRRHSGRPQVRARYRPRAVFKWKFRYPLFLAITIGAFNQFAGINAILYYQGTIFKAAGFSQLSGDLQAIAIGLTNFLFCMVGMSVIDRFGRKSLLLVGAVGTFLCLSGVAWIFISQSHQSALLALLVIYVAFFSMSQGAVIWVYISEVFPTSVRSKGQGIGSASHWIMNTIIAFAFPVLATRFGAGIPFVVFAGFTLLQLIVVAAVLSGDKRADAGRAAAEAGARVTGARTTYVEWGIPVINSIRATLYLRSVIWP